MADMNADGLFLKKIDLENPDMFQEIKKRLDEIELKDRLKRTLLGGYSKKSVSAVVDGYKKMIAWMQDTYDYQIKELDREKEKLFGERAILKKQLNEELEKKRDYEAKEHQVNELKAQIATLERKELLLEKERERLENANLRLEEEDSESAKKDESIKILKEKICSIGNAYNLLKQQHEALEESIREKSVSEENKIEVSGTIGELSLQLENLTLYCKGLEKERTSLEKQMSSIKTINGELERMSQEFDIQKDELKDYQKKYLNVKMENTSLCKEMESTSQVLEEILMQLEGKEEEKESIKLELENEKQRVMKALREKLDLQNQNVALTEQLYTLQEEANNNRMELNRLRVDQKNDQGNQKKVVHLESSKTGELKRKTKDEEKAREAINQAKKIAQKVMGKDDNGMKEVK